MLKNELVLALLGIDEDFRVVIANDEEGNSFSDVSEYSIENDDDSELYSEFGGPLIVLWP